MLDSMQYRICETQAELYEYAAIHGFNVPDFSDTYLKSDFCKRAMDSSYSRFQLQCPEEILDFFQYDTIRDSGVSGPVAYWIGFTYRQLAFETGLPSKDLLDLYPFSLMLSMYPGMHTQDPEYVGDVLLENYKKRLNCG